MVVIFLIYFLFWVYITVSQSFFLDSREGYIIQLAALRNLKS